MTREERSGFGDRSKRFIQYPSQHAVFHFLDDVLATRDGLGVLHGPDDAAKSDLIEQIAVKVAERAAVAVVDGMRMRPESFLSATLMQFGYELDLDSADELLNMLCVFGVQQTRSHEAPVLIVENFNHMFPSALCVLCKLAMLKAGDRFALRIILVGDGNYHHVIESPSMRPVASRLCGDFELQPLTARESLVYLYARLESLGVANPDSVFVTDVCAALYADSEGWPGKLDGIADTVMDRAANFPIRYEDLGDEELPEIIVSYNGQVLRRVILREGRTLLGRSELCDVVLENQFVSKHHALIVCTKESVVLADLKSHNGTMVNSTPVKSQVLRDSDIIGIGDFRIKVLCPPSFMPALFTDPDLADTARMQSIADARRKRAQQGLALVGRPPRKAQR